jgi:hypothetical protein
VYNIVIKLSLVEIPWFLKIIRRIFDVSSEGPSFETSKFSLYFSGICIPTNESLLLLALYLHWHGQFHVISSVRHSFERRGVLHGNTNPRRCVIYERAYIRNRLSVSEYGILIR